MKNLTGVALLPFLLCGVFVSHSVYAADPVSITVTGNIVASPCTIDPESVSRKVPLGDIQAADMANAGSASPWTNFNIKVINCPAGTSYVTATFSGAASEDNPDIAYQNTGTATNVAVELQGTGGEPFGNGKNFKLPISASKDATWNLQARAYTSKGGVTPGTISSVITMSFTYN